MRAASISVATGWKEGNKMSYHLLFSERARDKPSAGMLTLKHIWKSTADRELCQHHHCHGRALTPPSRTRIWCWKHHRNWMSKKEVLCNTTHLCIISTHRHTHMEKAEVSGARLCCISAILDTKHTHSIRCFPIVGCISQKRVPLN